MRLTPLCLMLAFMTATPALAEEPATPRSSILLCTELCFDARQGEGSLRKQSRPTVLTADQCEAVVVVEDNAESGFRQQLKVLPHLEGGQIQLNLNAQVSQGQQACLQQSLQASVTPGCPVVCEIDNPQSHQRLRVVVTPWVVGPHQRFQGIDKDTGKPMLVDFVSK